MKENRTPKAIISADSLRNIGVRLEGPWPALRPCARAAPVFPWLGGKRNSAKFICEAIRYIPHALYVEPFFGGGGVFLRRAHVSQSEIINDINGEIINFYRFVRDDPEAVCARISWLLCSREVFEEMKATDPATLSHIDRAVRTVYLARCSFGGRLIGSFGVSSAAGREKPWTYSMASSPSFIASAVADAIRRAHARLSCATIENVSFEKMLERYDHPRALFYMDPPYIGNESDYGDGFSADHMGLICDFMRNARSAVMLSINAKGAALDLARDLPHIGVDLKYSISASGNNHAAKELIIFGGRLARD